MMLSALNNPTLSWAVLRDLPVSARIDVLHQRFTRRYAEMGSRLYIEPDEADQWCTALLDSYRDTRGMPPIIRRARALERFADHIPVRIDADDLLVGRQSFCRPLWQTPEIAGQLRELGYAATTGHIVHDYAGMLTHGIAGYQEDIETARILAYSDDVHVNLHAFSIALGAFRRYIARHAEEAERLAQTLTGDRQAEWARRACDLQLLTQQPPATFAQAIQLVWFTQLFLHAENPEAAISYGRLDQYLWPFLRADLHEGRITLPAAFDLVCAFLIKSCEGEESQNAVLGGVDGEGHDVTNPLSLLFIAAMRRLSTFQPSLSVRLHPASPPDFIQAACELAAVGNGNPGFMNDDVVTAGLQELGIPLERARDWGIVGCYEATPQGDAYPNTVLGQLHLVALISQYLATDTAQQSADFAQFLDGWFAFVRDAYLNTVLPQCQTTWDAMRANAPSPFGSIVMQGCIANGRPLEDCGTAFNLVGINILGLGTVVDSLHAVREVVFTQQALTLRQLAEAVAEDFPDAAVRRSVRQLPGRYGTDSEATNALAHQVSETLARMVLESRLERGVRPYPGFFRFGADIYELQTASPDGRRRSDLISYGIAPASAVATSPTSSLLSASHVAQSLAACGNPFSLTLPCGESDTLAALIREMVTTYFALGGSHLHCNIMGPDDLRAAQRHPEEHAALTVRVSGYSARFVTIDAKWQDALIERAELGR